MHGRIFLQTLHGVYISWQDCDTVQLSAIPLTRSLSPFCCFNIFRSLFFLTFQDEDKCLHLSSALDSTETTDRCVD